SAGPMRQLDDERNLIRAINTIVRWREQQKASVILTTVFEVFAQNRAAILLRREPARNRCAARVSGGNYARHAGRGVLGCYPTNLWVRGKKTTTLFESHRMRFSGPDFFKRSALASN